jgi:tetratricopeptide (TPR) repeat protein
VAKAYMMRGIAKGITGDFENGVADLNASARLDSADYKLYFYYGKIYLLHGDFTMAEQYYDIAVAKNSTDPKNYDDRAVAKGYLKKFDEAIKDEDRAISLDHGNNIFYVNRGFMKAGKQEYADAIADYTTAIKIKPSHNAYADRGFAFYQVKQYQKAIDDFTAALAINPADYDIYYRRGIAYKAIANMDKACFDFKRSASLGYPPAKEELTKINCN